MRLDNESYRMIMDFSIIVTVDVIFIKNGKEVLLGLRENKPLQGEYYFPGGRIEKGETVLDALKRKSLEETGIKIDLHRLKFVKNYDDFFNESIFEGVTLQNISITYFYELEESEIKMVKIGDSQHSDMRFFDVKDSNLCDGVKIRINDLQNMNLL